LCVIEFAADVAPDFFKGGIYCRLEFRDMGATSSDPFLRQAVAEFNNPEFRSIAGISGSPVFNKTANALCVMVVRGGMTDNKCTIYYFDMSDIVRRLRSVKDKVPSNYYTKKILRSRT
jgi:hypothetical protein